MRQARTFKIIFNSTSEQKDGKKAVIFFKKGKEMEKHKGSEISDDGRKVISGR